jgi:hypothetical protein
MSILTAGLYGFDPDFDSRSFATKSMVNIQNIGRTYGDHGDLDLCLRCASNNRARVSGFSATCFRLFS